MTTTAPREHSLRAPRRKSTMAKRHDTIHLFRPHPDCSSHDECPDSIIIICVDSAISKHRDRRASWAARIHHSIRPPTSGGCARASTEGAPPTQCRPRSYSSALTSALSSRRPSLCDPLRQRNSLYVTDFGRDSPRRAASPWKSQAIRICALRPLNCTGGASWCSLPPDGWRRRRREPGPLGQASKVRRQRRRARAHRLGQPRARGDRRAGAVARPPPGARVGRQASAVAAQGAHDRLSHSLALGGAPAPMRRAHSHPPGFSPPPRWFNPLQGKLPGQSTAPPADSDRILEDPALREELEAAKRRAQAADEYAELARQRAEAALQKATESEAEAAAALAEQRRTESDKAKQRLQEELAMARQQAADAEARAAAEARRRAGADERIASAKMKTAASLAETNRLLTIVSARRQAGFAPANPTIPRRRPLRSLGRPPSRRPTHRTRRSRRASTRSWPPPSPSPTPTRTTSPAGGCRSPRMLTTTET